jgi:hypothetical protein
MPAPTTPVQEPTPVPDRYTRTAPELTVEFAGGNQRFDLPLTR